MRLLRRYRLGKLAVVLWSVLFWRSAGAAGAEVAGAPAAVKIAESAKTARKQADDRLARLSPRARVYVISLTNKETTQAVSIGPWQAELVRRSLAEAKEWRADLVLLRVDSEGGVATAAEDVCKALHDSGLPVVAFIDRRARGGGALVALAADRIYMSSWAVLGDAVPAAWRLEEPLPEAGPARERAINALRVLVRTLAEMKGWPSALCEAMLDPNLEVLEATDPRTGDREFLSAKALAGAPEGFRFRKKRAVAGEGRVLLLSAQEAREAGFCHRLVADETELFEDLGLTAPAVRHAAPKSVEAAGAPAGNERITESAKATRAQADARLARLPANARVFIIPMVDKETTQYGMIDPWQAEFVKKRLEEAKEWQTDLLLLYVDSNGGAVTAVEDICKTLNGSGLPVVAFVDHRARSGGAIVSLAADRIYMSRLGVIGDAMPILLGPTGPTAGDELLQEKVKSGLRAAAEAQAQAKGWPVALCLAMVDPKIEVFEVRNRQTGGRDFLTATQLEDSAMAAKYEKIRKAVAKDELLTLSAKGAYEAGICHQILNTESELLKDLGVTNPVTHRAFVRIEEGIVRWLNNPLIAVLLITIALGTLFIELKTPGHGIGYLVSLVCFAIFFWIKLVADHASLLEIILFGVGMVLLALELFVILGFGVAGISGLALIGISIFFSFLPEGAQFAPLESSAEPWQMEVFAEGAKWAAITLLVGVAFVVVVMWKVHAIPVARNIVLEGAIHSEASATQALEPERRPDFTDLVGKTGTSLTTLRPAGRAEFAGKTYDVVSDGEWLPARQKIKVVAVEGRVITVEKVEA